MFRRRKQKTCPHLFLFGCPYCSTGTDQEGAETVVASAEVQPASKPVVTFAFLDDDDIPPMPATPIAEVAGNGSDGAGKHITEVAESLPSFVSQETNGHQQSLAAADVSLTNGATTNGATDGEMPVTTGLAEADEDAKFAPAFFAPALRLNLNGTAVVPPASVEAAPTEKEAAIVGSDSEKSDIIRVSLNDTLNNVLPSSLNPVAVSAETVFAEVVAETAALTRDVPRAENLALVSSERLRPAEVSPMRTASSSMTSETAFPTLATSSPSVGTRKRKSRFSLSRLRTLVSDSLAIDMGSTSTIIAVHGRGIVVDEPSVVALHKLTGEPVAFGYEAHQMQGREAREITVVSPLVNGVVADWEVTQAMLDHFVKAAHSGFSHFSRRAIMSIVSGITQVEQRALLQAVERARINRTFMVEEGLAAALGGGVPPDDDRGSAVVDIGGSTTNVAAVAQGKIVHAHAERIGGNDINSAIVEHMRRHHGLGIGQQSAENLKIELGCATVPDNLGRTKLVKGRDIQTGSPGASEVTAGEIYAVAHPILHQIAKTVNQALTELPSEVAADIYDRGLILTGGGALLTGFVDYLNTETRLPVRLADEPRFAIVRGLAQMFEDPSLLHRIVRQEELELLEAEAQAFES